MWEGTVGVDDVSRRRKVTIQIHLDLATFAFCCDRVLSGKREKHCRNRGRQVSDRCHHVHSLLPRSVILAHLGQGECGDEHGLPFHLRHMFDEYLAQRVISVEKGLEHQKGQHLSVMRYDLHADTGIKSAFLTLRIEVKRHVPTHGNRNTALMQQNWMMIAVDHQRTDSRTSI